MSSVKAALDCSFVGANGTRPYREAPSAAKATSAAAATSGVGTGASAGAGAPGNNNDNNDDDDDDDDNDDDEKAGLEIMTLAHRSGWCKSNSVVDRPMP